MAEALSDYLPAADSNPAAAMVSLANGNKARLASAGDPHQVAVAIEASIDAPSPPARVVVGADAESMVKLVEGTDAESFAALLRDFAKELMG